jgi:hypothetical protein
MTPYIVRQGDSVASVLAKNGGGDPASVWNDANNADLQKLRGDPAVLCPGDVLYIPETKPAWLSVSVGTTNTFTAQVPTQTVKLVLCGEKPLANEPYVVTELGDDIQGTTDGDGALSVDVPMTASSFVLVLSRRNIAHRVLVGHLDPVSERSGIRQRLSNLGYGSTIAPILEQFGVTSEYGVEHRLRAFQLMNGLEPTGDADTATTEALRTAHGT